jgi:hypothetical protein
MKPFVYVIGAVALWSTSRFLASAVEEAIASGNQYAMLAAAHVIAAGGAIALAYGTAKPYIARKIQGGRQ